MKKAFLISATGIMLALILVFAGYGCSNKNEGAMNGRGNYSGETNKERVAFLQSFGWEIDPEPAEVRKIMIPAQFDDVYTAYNAMQKAQGFDLEPYAGEVCTQYKYKINNYPNETEVYATLLVYGKVIIGGDISSAETDGFMHGFAADSARYGETAGN